MSEQASIQVQSVLGKAPGHPDVVAFLDGLSNASAGDPITKGFSGVVYHDYPTLGVSLEYKVEAATKEVLLDGIDIENHERNNDELVAPSPDIPKFRGSRTRPTPPRNPFPAYPLRLPSHPPLSLVPSTTAATLVKTLGEPTRKGGGSQGLGIWLEWTYLEDEVPVGLFFQWRGRKLSGAVPGMTEKIGNGVLQNLQIVITVAAGCYHFTFTVANVTRGDVRRADTSMCTFLLPWSVT